MNKPTKIAIVLRLDQCMVDRIDEARRPLRMNRSTSLRKAVARNLQYATEHELPLVARKEIQSALMAECK